jgi:hypothetical protein
MVRISGTEGYAEEARSLFDIYEGLSSAEVHKSVLHLIPSPPCDLLDIGAARGGMRRASPRWAIASLPWNRLTN